MGSTAFMFLVSLTGDLRVGNAAAASSKDTEKKSKRQKNNTGEFIISQ